MDVIYYLFAGAVAVAAALASLAIWAPRVTRVRLAAVVLAAVFIPVAYVQMLEMLSKPKPMSLEWFQGTTDRAVVLGAHFDEGKAIYLWLFLPGETAPRYYKIPWNVHLAERLEDAVDDAVKTRSTVILRNPFDMRRTLEDWGEVNVEIVPPPLPPRKLPHFPPQIINPREFNI